MALQYFFGGPANAIHIENAHQMRAPGYLRSHVYQSTFPSRRKPSMGLSMAR